jgi:redox-sensitive bicupin YhaK (pirin superfamily)
MTIVHVLEPHLKDLGGGFIVRRLLPSALRQAVGPFVFFDHFGPVIHQPDDNHDVRPHPHIGLSTVTYLFEGAMMHRDSTGVVQRIEPGAINWMTAGRGIVHSERTPDDLRGTRYASHGLQLWCALPESLEECDPAFAHTPAADIPQVQGEGYTARVLIGELLGVASPVKPTSPTLYAEFSVSPGAVVQLPASGFERALYGLEGAVRIDGELLGPWTLGVLDGEACTIAAPDGARFALIGGEPLGHRHMVWNFVSSRRERIDEAKAAWRAQAMGQVPGETEFIPY